MRSREKNSRDEPHTGVYSYKWEESSYSYYPSTENTQNRRHTLKTSSTTTTSATTSNEVMTIPPPPVGGGRAIPGRPQRRFKGKKRKMGASKNSSTKRKSNKQFWNGWSKWWSSNDSDKSKNSQSLHSLLLAVVLWYSLGVISISTSKLLLTPPSESSIESPRQHHHVGGVAPLVLTLQQLFLGSNFLRFLLSIRFMGSAGLQPYESLYQEAPSSPSSSLRNDSPIVVRSLLKNKETRYLVFAGLCFTLGFWATNVGFHGTSASFVETIKAAEPITSATLAVAWGLEVLTGMEVSSLLSIVVGVLLSTFGHAQPSSSSTSSSTLWDSFLSCAVVMTSNLCFSFRGLFQKLFRANHAAHVVDDLNLQFRMQQLGVWLLVVPCLLWDGPSAFRHVYHATTRVGLFSSGLLLRYIGLSVVNGFAFTSYK